MEKTHHPTHHAQLDSESPKRNRKAQSLKFVVAGLCLILIVLWLKNVTNTKQPTSTYTAQLPTPVAFATLPPVSPTMQQGPYGCPIAKTFCTKGTPQEKNNVSLGMGWKAELGTPILASFDGEITAFEKITAKSPKEEKITVVTLENKIRGLYAVYYFNGTLPKQKSVKKGETIAKTGNPISYYNNASLLFQLIKGDIATGQRALLTIKDFN